jgi:hypothetical protein
MPTEPNGPIFSNGQPRPRNHNLNDEAIDNADGPPVLIASLPHRKAAVVSGTTTVVFDYHARVLSDEIRRWPVVVGCTAWLTNEDVLLALRERSVSLIVQKEDWLRPDDPGSRALLREMYGKLQGISNFEAGVFYNIPEQSFDAVMCCGIANDDQNQPVQRMHHKFMVFCDAGIRLRTFSADGLDVKEEMLRLIEPKAVWTGSFNPTHNGTRNLENTVLIRDEVIARAYFDEWKAVLGLAEPLDWEAEWVAPINRFGYA